MSPSLRHDKDGHFDLTNGSDYQYRFPLNG